MSLSLTQPQQEFCCSQTA